MATIILNSEQYGTLDIIISGVSQATGIPVELFTHKTRKREVVQARQMVMWLACRKAKTHTWNKRFGDPVVTETNKPYTELTLKQIGKFLGGRDHTTVIHGREFFQDIFDTYEEAPGRCTIPERKMISTLHSVEHKLNLARLEYETINTGRDDSSELHVEGEDGRIEGEDLEPVSKPIIKWDAVAISERGNKERCGSNIVHCGESCSGKSRILETHF